MIVYVIVHFVYYNNITDCSCMWLVDPNGKVTKILCVLCPTPSISTVAHTGQTYDDAGTDAEGAMVVDIKGNSYSDTHQEKEKELNAAATSSVSRHTYMSHALWAVTGDIDKPFAGSTFADIDACTMVGARSDILRMFCCTTATLFLRRRKHEEEESANNNSMSVSSC